MKITVQREKERFAVYSHIVGLVLAFVGVIILIVFCITSNNLQHLAVVFVYSICMCYMFSASVLYHAHKKSENDRDFWRTFDHVGIYFMIAGSYTIVSFLYVDDIFKWIIFSLQWSFVIFGSIIKIMKIEIPTWLDVGIYLIMGWMIAIRMNFIFTEFPLKIFLLVILGGISYTIGAILHAINKPYPIPGKFEFHDMFHILIIVGAALHYLAVLFFFVS